MQGVTAYGAGHFLSHIVKAAFHADGENAELMYPLLTELQKKYPQYTDPPQSHSKQIITVVLTIRKDQSPYKLVEKHGAKPYEALRHFFEDIEYNVEQLVAHPEA
jgi:hypothetical protein